MFDRNLDSCPLCNQKLTQKARDTANERVAKNIISAYREQQAKERLPCPKCGLDNMADDVVKNALSRVADVMICDQCGMIEAIEAFEGRKQSLLSWWVIEAFFP